MNSMATEDSPKTTNDGEAAKLQNAAIAAEIDPVKKAKKVITRAFLDFLSNLSPMPVAKILAHRTVHWQLAYEQGRKNLQYLSLCLAGRKSSREGCQEAEGP